MVMEKSNYHLRLILLSVSSLLFICFPGSTTWWVYAAEPAAAPPVLNLTVEQICQKTSYPSRCISSFTPFPAESLDSPTAILGAAVNATVNSTQVAIAAGTRLLSDQGSTMNSYETYLIQKCQENYGQAIKDLQTALWAMAEGDDLLFIGLVKEAKMEYVDCEPTFTDAMYLFNDPYPFPNGLPDDFTPVNLEEMADNCLDINNAIH